MRLIRPDENRADITPLPILSRILRMSKACRVLLISITVFSAPLYGSVQSLAMGGVSAVQSGAGTTLDQVAGISEVKHFTTGMGYDVPFGLQALATRTLWVVGPLVGHATPSAPAWVSAFDLQYFGEDLFHETQIGFSLARKIHPRWSLGSRWSALNRYVVQDRSSWKFSATWGVLFQAATSCHIGVTFQHAVLGDRNDQTLGIGSWIVQVAGEYRLSEEVSCVAQWSYATEYASRSICALGCEYHPVSLLALRCGVSGGDIWQYSMGCGIPLWSGQIDFALTTYTYLGNQISISWMIPW